ncbi:GNAT family N-acetyltransferase [Pseudorhodoplanes sp.]|uniref:GNAT family N-acetyltransferase n=1 Tax=Pseudorhodoplanes sp. TaxID=1934341 RepID=UPI002D09ED8B|nr:GNAT family N-acetyltransferase [Pseudorhodoplanes sp.]HWV53320.1 GNAT family N-acetyltransferase [Pseudorhodoplanes sp.]
MSETAAAHADHPLKLQLRVVSDLRDVRADAWDACANASQVSDEQSHVVPDGASTAPAAAGNPFVSHAFLSALERSESATPRTGWAPQHLLAETEDGELLGAVPCYLKSHSRGEYVFDAGWADAYERAGGSYYPKLQASVPFTPATGPRLLVKPSPHAGVVKDALSRGLVALCERRQASSVHVTFLPKQDWDMLGAKGFLKRTDQQFHWQNEGYGTFDDFLSALASRKRKAIRRERRDAIDSGITIEHLTGTDLTEAVWDDFFAFYMDTGSRKWGRPYLTRAFYSLIGQSMADRILLVMAKRNGRHIAGAINFIGANSLFGRHWGAIEHHPLLHFELCYYQAIDFAIANKLATVEAGAQGEHKLARGYVPVTTYSSHYIDDPALRRAIADYLTHERAYVDAAGRELEGLTPFRKTDA